jgi:heptosyltransferase-1
MPRVLISRLSAIGDCLQTLPLVHAIKEHWPTAHITWIVDCGVASILETQPMIDQIVRLPKGFLKRPGALWRLRQSLRCQPFDISFDPQGLFKSALLGWLSGAACQVGFASPQAREQAWRFYHHRITPVATHLVDRHLELLKPWGVRPTATFAWYEPAAVAADGEHWLAEAGLERQQYFVINPGAGWASRRWSMERYGEVIGELYQRYQQPTVVLWGNQAERAMAEQIVAAQPRGAQLAPDTSLMQLSAIIRRSRLYLGSDAGPTHLAAAVGTPCVAMFGTTRGEYSGPYGKQHRCLQKRLDEGSSRYRRHTGNAAMLEIQVADVLQAIDESLRANATPPQPHLVPAAAPADRLGLSSR